MSPSSSRSARRPVRSTTRPTAFARRRTGTPSWSGVTNYRKPTHDTIAGAQRRACSSARCCSPRAGCRRTSGWSPTSRPPGPRVRSGPALAGVAQQARDVHALPLLRPREAGGRAREALALRPRLRPRHLRGRARSTAAPARCGSTSPAARRAASWRTCRAPGCWSPPARSPREKSYEYPQWGESVWSGLRLRPRARAGAGGRQPERHDDGRRGAALGASTTPRRSRCASGRTAGRPPRSPATRSAAGRWRTPPPRGPSTSPRGGRSRGPPRARPG